jgi:hypothetical protein
MTSRSETDIDRVLARTAVEYVQEEEHAAAAEAQEAAASAVFSVRLHPAVHEAVKVAAAHEHTTPSALIRRWITERVEAAQGSDLPAAIAALRRDVETIAALVVPAPRDS